MWKKFFAASKTVHIICRTGKWRYCSSLRIIFISPLPIVRYIWQRVMVDSLGPSWASNFTSFEPIPFAAASLGQVHSAVLAAHVSPTGKDEKVAVKIQFPDIAKSIDNDLGYLKILLTAGKLLPKGLFLDKTISVSIMNVLSNYSFD